MTIFLNQAEEFRSLSICTVSKDDNHSRGRPGGFLFNSYYTEVLGRVRHHSLDCSTLPSIRTLYYWVLRKDLSGVIFWVFGRIRTIGEHSTRNVNEPVYVYFPLCIYISLPAPPLSQYIYIYICVCVCVCVCDGYQKGWLILWVTSWNKLIKAIWRFLECIYTYIYIYMYILIFISNL